MRQDLQKALSRAQGTVADVARLIGIIDAALAQASDDDQLEGTDARKDKVSLQQLQCFWILNKNKAVNKEKYLSLAGIVDQLPLITTTSGKEVAQPDRVSVYIERAADRGHVHLNDNGDATLMPQGAGHLKRRQGALKRP